MQEFKAQNLRFFRPKKDQCDTYVGHELGNINDALYQEHRERKDQVRMEKSNDKSEAETEQSKVVLTRDMQLVLITSRGQCCILQNKISNT